MQNISYLVVVKYLAILAGIYEFLNYSIVLLYYVYVLQHKSHLEQKCKWREWNFWRDRDTRKFGYVPPSTTTFAKKTNFTSTIVYVV